MADSPDSHDPPLLDDPFCEVCPDLSAECAQLEERVDKLEAEVGYWREQATKLDEVVASLSAANSLLDEVSRSRAAEIARLTSYDNAGDSGASLE